MMCYKKYLYVIKRHLTITLIIFGVWKLTGQFLKGLSVFCFAPKARPQQWCWKSLAAANRELLFVFIFQLLSWHQIYALQNFWLSKRIARALETNSTVLKRLNVMCSVLEAILLDCSELLWMLYVWIQHSCTICACSNKDNQIQNKQPIFYSLEIIMKGNK